MKIRRMNNNILEICDEQGQVILAIAEKLTDNAMQIKISGAVKNEVAHEFEDEVMAAVTICSNKALNLEIDFSETTYIASMTLRSLLTIQQTIDELEHSEMVLINPSPEVMETLEESGFTDILTIEKT